MNTLLMSVYLLFKNMFSEDEGQDLVEYALIIALVSIVVVVALTLVGTNINAIFNSIAGKIAV